MLGLWDEALARAAEAEALAANEFVRGLLLQVAPIYLHRGDLDGVRRLLARARARRAPRTRAGQAVYALTEAMLHACGRASRRGGGGRRPWAGPAGSGGRLPGRDPVRRPRRRRRTSSTTRSCASCWTWSTSSIRASRGRSCAPRRHASAPVLPEHDAGDRACRGGAPVRGGRDAVLRRRHAAGARSARCRRPGRGARCSTQARETFEQLRARPWLERVDSASRCDAEVPA